MYGTIGTFFFQYMSFPDGHKELVYGEQFQLTFSCRFHFNTFPFDSHKCRIEFGDLLHETEKFNLMAARILVRGYPYIGPKDDPIILKDLPFPYEFQIQSLPSFELDFGQKKYSYAGVLMTLKRQTIGHLLIAYYYPTAAFALLSMISYLIDADIVRFMF